MYQIHRIQPSIHQQCGEFCFFSDKGHRKKRETLHIWIRRFRFVVGGVSGPCCSSWLCDSEDDVRLCDCDHLFGFPVKFLSKERHVISSSKLQTLYKWWKRPDLLASKAVALSPPSDGLLGRWELRTVTKYGTKRFHESVWNDSDIYNWCNVIYCNQFRCNVIQKKSWTEAWPNPCNSHVIHTASAYSTCAWRSCVRVFGSKPCAALRVEVCCWRGAGSCRSAKVFELPTWHTVTQFSAQGPATSDAATETAQNLATLTRAAKCWRAQDRNINYCWCNFCLVYLISRGILPLNGLVLVTVDHPSSKLRHGSQRFLWCCYSSRGRKNFEVNLGEISWNNVKA